jgi:NAD(P)-dependent dehydrogenase (short-subunit alcohol dehydrogenase family)
MSWNPARRTALVTGATSGLGRAIAFALAERDLRILVHGRDARRTAGIVEELRARGADAAPYLADLASLAHVRALAQRVVSEEPALHVLINNAGVGAGPPPHRTRELSADGHELRFAVNYLAPALLTRLLLPLLRASAPARVVNIGSVGQSPVDLADLGHTVRYNGPEAYFRSKFALAALTIELGEQINGTGVTVNCVHPATFMDTAMVREAGVAPSSSVADGVRAVLALAVGDTGAVYSGEYFEGRARARAHRRVYKSRVRADLDQVTDVLLSPFELDGIRGL